MIFDEYHFGAWKENAKKLFEREDEDSYDSENLDSYSRGDACDETWLPITTSYYLYLSGTPFRALNSGEFIEEQIGYPITLVSNGPARDDIIYRKSTLNK